MFQVHVQVYRLVNAINKYSLCCKVRDSEKVVCGNNAKVELLCDKSLSFAWKSSLLNIVFISTISDWSLYIVLSVNATLFFVLVLSDNERIFCSLTSGVGNGARLSFLGPAIFHIFTMSARRNHTTTSFYCAIVGLTKRSPVIQTQTLFLDLFGWKYVEK